MRGGMPHPVAARRGYTLVEMLIVLAVLVVLVTLTWPSVRGMLGKSEIRQAAKLVRAALVKGRLRAIESGVVQRFRYGPGTGTFELGPLRSPFDDEPSSWPSAESTPTAEPEPLQGTLPSGVTFESPDWLGSLRGTDISPGRGEDSGWSRPVLFFPNGRCSSARIRLAGPRDWSIELTLHGVTGAARIGPLQRPEDEP